MSYPPYSPYPPYPVEPQRPRNRNWWVWISAGCSTVGLLLLLGLVGMGLLTNQAVSSIGAAKSLTRSEVASSLGGIPLYPRGTIDMQQTRIRVGTYRAAEKIAGKQPGQLFKGTVVQYSRDSPQQVSEFYDRKLAAQGWDAPVVQDLGVQQMRQYRRGNEVCMVQMQQLGGQTSITIIRGAPELGGRAGIMTTPSNPPVPKTVEKDYR